MESAYNLETRPFPRQSRRETYWQEILASGKPTDLSGELRGSVSRDFKFNSTDKNGFSIPSESFVEMKFRVQEAAVGGASSKLDDYIYDKKKINEGATLNDNSSAGVIKPNALSWFSNQELTLGTHSVERNNQYAGIVNNCRTLIASNGSYRDSRGSQLLLNYVTAETETNRFAPGQIPNTSVHEPIMNQSCYKQAMAASHNCEVNCFVPLADLFSYFRDVKHVMHGLEFEMNLELDSDDVLFSGRAVTGTPGTPALVAGDSRAKNYFLSWVGFGMKLWMKKVSPQAEILRSIKDYTTPIIDNFQANTIQMRQCLNGEKNISWQISLPSSTRINDIIVCGQVVDRTSSDRRHDASRFDHCGITKISASLNGQLVPRNSLESKPFTTVNSDDPPAPEQHTNAATEQYAEAYAAYLDLHESHAKNASHHHQGLIAYENFRYYPLYCFNLFDAVDQSEGLPSINQLTIDITRNTFASFEAHQKAATPSTGTGWNELVDLRSSDFNLFCIANYNKSIKYSQADGIVTEVTPGTE